MQLLSNHSPLKVHYVSNDDSGKNDGVVFRVVFYWKLRLSWIFFSAGYVREDVGLKCCVRV